MKIRTLVAEVQLCFEKAEKRGKLFKDIIFPTSVFLDFWLSGNKSWDEAKERAQEDIFQKYSFKDYIWPLKTAISKSKP